MAVKPQPDSPLRLLSVKAYRLGDSGYFRMRASVENVSGRDIGSYGLRRAEVGSERRETNPTGHSRLPHFSAPGRALRPGQVDVTNAGAPVPGDLLPRLTYEVQYVVFMDGMIWCADVCRIAEYLAGDCAGGRAAVGRLRIGVGGGRPRRRD